MKRLLLILIIFFFLTGATMADFINHPMYAKVNTFVESVVQSIIDAQNDFFVVNGRYFQGLWLLGDVQVDGTTDETVINASSPSDFGFSWKEFSTVFKNNLKIPVNIKIDVYESPRGWGWKSMVEVVYPGLDPDAYGNYGNRWVYQHHEGPDSQSGIFDEWYIEELPE
jgi:hypothetical protein